MTPLDWTEPTAATLDGARRAVDARLRSPDAAQRVATFFAPSSDYAGLTFHTLPPVPVDAEHDDLTAADLLAVTLMEVTASPRAVRHLLEAGEHRDRVLAALRNVPTNIDLPTAAPTHLDAAAELYAALKSGLGGRNKWVTASKLAARKRPALIPVRDSVVVALLGLPNRDFRSDWLVFRHLVEDKDLVARLHVVAATATAEHDAPDLSGVPDLRLLDALLWMRPPVPDGVGDDDADQ